MAKIGLDKIDCGCQGRVCKGREGKKSIEHFGMWLGIGEGQR